MSTSDPYQMHRIALGPLLPGVSEEDLVRFCMQATAVNESEFLDFLHQQGLAPLWGNVLDNPVASNPVSETFKASAHQARMEATGQYLIHRNQLDTIKKILEDASIGHAVYKGAHTRECYYTEPALRPAVDIDILVSDEDKIAAIKAFKQHGFEFHAVAKNISHEASLVKGNTSVDLHWDILRPGRTRFPMTDTLLETRRDYGSHWGLSHEANLFVMLVHPVFVRYSTTPLASLKGLVDLAHLISREDLQWGKTIELLESAGLMTSAWITLQWMKLLMGSGPNQEVIEKLRPGKLRQFYLERWLEYNIATRLLIAPQLVQLGFTLPAHDTLADALRALRLIRSAGRGATEELQAIESSLAPTA